ncbi:ion transporter [Chloracidobacterium sp. D]|uniref:ion transporter n=1 Tax=Chloracidobacterium sp. D TaxID=2821536 RepID=UPI001B8A9689|nr:ion transporter [Chloracidobacterium sp. D]QUV80878.1 ion transporter [Chloracidobacterium sp. D]
MAKQSEEPHLGRWELFIQAVILLSLVDFALETLPSLSPTQRRLLEWFEVFSVAVFTVEYVVRAVGSRPPVKYLLSFYGIVDLVAILPFYLGLVVDLRSLRALRFLRLLRILKLTHYSQAWRRFHRALIISREELILFAATALILIYLAAVGIYYFEHEAQPEVFASMFDGLWWAVATLTTVGYGDSYPITAGGRFFTFVILVIGLGIVALPSGIVASALAKARAEEDEAARCGKTGDPWADEADED